MAGVLAAACASLITGYILHADDWVRWTIFHQTPLVATPSVVNPSATCEGGDGWVQPASAKKPPLSEYEASKWTPASAAIPATPQKITILTQGKDEGIVITGVGLVNLRRIAIPQRTHYQWYDECGGGPVTTVDLGYQLSDNAPSPSDMFAPNRAVDQAGMAGRQAKSVNFPRVISAAAPDNYVLHIFMNGTKAYVFDVKVSWRSGDHSGALVLNNGGRHYRIAGIKGAANLQAKDGRWNTISATQAEGGYGGVTRPGTRP